MDSLLNAEQPEVAASDTVESLRVEIDALDDAIIELVLARMRLSVRIQTARISAGGPRIVLSRERTIRNRYLTALGTAGAAVADAMLRACRGAH
jgi:chorismate mutase